MVSHVDQIQGQLAFQVLALRPFGERREVVLRPRRLDAKQQWCRAHECIRPV